ncbi:MAG: glycosyltransferase [Candidatus Krumholzibacteriota bacterium]|nr:glycosyltransferase [Candidatus Krumholzibacteriota bacterium]
MRIAFLGDGSLGHIRRWAGYFHKRKHDVLLLSFEDISSCDFPAFRLPKYLPTKLAGYLSVLPAVRSAIRKFQPDLVNGLYAGGYGLLASIVSPGPLVISTLGSDLLVDYPSSIIHRLQIRHALGKADLVTTDSDNLTKAAIDAGTSPEKILKVFFGIEEDLFYPVSRTCGNGKRESGAVNIITTRNLYDIYNIELLIDSAPLIAEKTDAVFTICGDGPLRGSLEERVAEKGMTGQFRFRGRLSPDKVAEELRNSDIYVSTSFSDSTSVSLLEAMACGPLPVVTDIPANREWIEDGKNGFLVPVDSPAILADTILESLINPDRLESIRKRNLSIIREKGLWEPNMRLLEDRFLSLVGARNPRSSTEGNNREA